MLPLHAPAKSAKTTRTTARREDKRTPLNRSLPITRRLAPRSSMVLHPIWVAVAAALQSRNNQGPTQPPTSVTDRLNSKHICVSD